MTTEIETRPSEYDNTLFPDPSEITSHAIEFARLMFVHSSFEREVSALQDAITDKEGFGEQPENRRWGARQRPGRMVELIKQWRGDAFETARIESLLTEAIAPCDERNLLAHGSWWCFNRRTSTIVVRGATRWEHSEVPPEQREYTALDIRAVAEKLATIEVGLYRLRLNIEARRSEAELRVESPAATGTRPES